jgi:hypothetical protein
VSVAYPNISTGAMNEVLRTEMVVGR